MPAAPDAPLQTASPAPRQPELNDADQLPTIQESLNGKAAGDYATTSKQKQKRHIHPKLSAPTIAPAALRPTTNAGAWKAPDDWAISPTEPVISGGITEDINNAAATDQLASLTLDLTHMEREIDHMQNASPQVILQRLKDSCGRYNSDAVNMEMDTEDDHGEATRRKDATVTSRDWELKKQRWLLSALYNMETVWGTKQEVSQPAMKPAARKILALFENQGVSSSLPSLSLSHTYIYTHMPRSTNSTV